MRKTIIVYGSSTGTTDAVATTIAEKLGLNDDAIINVSEVTEEQINEAEALLLGTSTWGDGELQDDWYDGIKVLKAANLQGKVVAFFGCGDCQSYPDTFCAALGVLYKDLQDSGATFVGAVSTDGYDFSDSEAVIDGKFVGCALDELNEDDQTEARIDAWLEEVRKSL